MAQLNVDPSVIGGLAGAVLAILFVLLLIAGGAIAAFLALDARFDGKLAAHEAREDKKSDERHEEIKTLISEQKILIGELEGRIDRMYERRQVQTG